MIQSSENLQWFAKEFEQLHMYYMRYVKHFEISLTLYREMIILIILLKCEKDQSKNI